MRPAGYEERTIEIGGWQVKLSSYQLEDLWHAKADNVSPGAWLARTTGTTREEAEEKSIARAAELLARTHRREI
jgi:hypothetical protein